MDQIKNIAIIGAGGFGREVKWLIDEINRKSYTWNFIGYFDDNPNYDLVHHDLIIGKISDVKNYVSDTYVVIAIGNPHVKRKIVEDLDVHQAKFPILIHPNVLIGNEVFIDEGTIICAGCILTTNIHIHKHVIINLVSTVGHDTVIKSFTSIMPGVNVSGEVLINEEVYIGTGAKIINQVTIGDSAIIGAGAVVVKEVLPQNTVIGVPAKPKI